MKEKVIYIGTKLLVVVVLVVVLAVSAFGKNTPKLTVIPYANERAFISVENVLNATAELTIEDEFGYIVYYREGNIGVDGFSKIYNLKNLFDGTYKVTLKTDRNVEEVIFVLENGKVVIDELVSEVLPFFEVTDNVLLFSLLNYNGEEVKMTLVNAEGVVYDKVLGDEFNITAGFKIDKLEAGEYALNVSNGMKSYSYKFKK